MNSALIVSVKRIHPEAVLPEYKSPGAACFDLHAVEGGDLHGGESRTFSTGLCFEVPEGYTMLVYSRSGLAFAHDITLSNGVGVIDSDYRGEVKVRLTNHGRSFIQIADGERVAQALVLPIPKTFLTEVTELSTTERGSSGFGSTGK